MNRVKKMACGAMLAASVLTCGMAAVSPAVVEAASTTEKILFGAAALLFVSQYYTRLDNNAQSQFLQECEKQTGVSDDAESENRVEGIYQTLVDSGDISRNYAVYVSPDNDINAFMSLGGVMCVNQGTLDHMDDEELAYTMAHELAHGEKRHSVNGVKKQVGLVTALDIYLSDDPSIGAMLLANIGANYISNAVFTNDQEKEADDIGFSYLVDAGYNPGAAAASMQVIYDRYGDLSRTGLKSVVAPSNHPKTSDRIAKNVKRMKLYSNNHVDVKDGWIVVNGDKTFQPVASGNYTAAERSYLSAGKLAKLYHEHKAGDVTFHNSALYCGDTSVYTVSSSEDGAAMAVTLGKAVDKDRGTNDKDLWKSKGKKVKKEAQETLKKAMDANTTTPAAQTAETGK